MRQARVPAFCQPAPSIQASSKFPSESAAATGYFWLFPPGDQGSAKRVALDGMVATHTRPEFSHAARVPPLLSPSHAELIGQMVAFQGWAKTGWKVSP